VIEPSDVLVDRGLAGKAYIPKDALDYAIAKLQAKLSSPSTFVSIVDLVRVLEELDASGAISMFHAEADESEEPEEPIETADLLH